MTREEELEISLSKTIEYYEKHISELNRLNVLLYAGSCNSKQTKDQLELTEKALELMAKSVWSEGISCMKFLDTGIQVNSQVEYLEYFKTKAKEMMKSE